MEANDFHCTEERSPHAKMEIPKSTESVSIRFKNSKQKLHV